MVESFLLTYFMNLFIKKRPGSHCLETCLEVISQKLMLLEDRTLVGVRTNTMRVRTQKSKLSLMVQLTLLRFLEQKIISERTRDFGYQAAQPNQEDLSVKGQSFAFVFLYCCGRKKKEKKNSERLEIYQEKNRLLECMICIIYCNSK